ncbi:MAG: penicillin-binding protein activator [Alphaproteobacteria bacterium]|nr:penicillin-binding protein activator [Alphaproteobacteria bacterium]MCL2757754.1 penicillin-binding protein activator [Alphaproteobacteria bacterium]
MIIKRISLFVLCLGFLAGCARQMPPRDWHREYGEIPASAAPLEMAPGFHTLEYGGFDFGTPRAIPAMDENVRTISVLLPLSGTNAALGMGIQHSIEIAFLQKQPTNIIVLFNDISGTQSERLERMRAALNRNPDLIIGPIFSEDVAMLKNLKDIATPALTFTSDTNVLGDGVFTFALMPVQSVEAIVQNTAATGASRMMILAPDTRAGHMLANAALDSARIHGVSVAGLYYYKENDMTSQKAVAERAAMFRPRQQALTRAREILSDALTTQNLTEEEHENMDAQLTRLNRADTIGNPPYDAVLLLGSPGDSKSLASFLRYFDVPAASVRFLGTAVWDTSSMWRDLTMSGAEYSALPAISPEFVRIYSALHGREPNRMNSMGYDAAMLAIGALSGGRPPAAHLLDPSGYRGLDGLVRLRPNGTNERALQIMRLNGSGAPRIRTQPARNFLTPLYQIGSPRASRLREIEPSDGFNALDYISMPAHLYWQYRSQTFRLSGASEEALDAARFTPIETVIPEDDSDAVIEIDPYFQPIPLDTIDRQLVESVTVVER